MFAGFSDDVTAVAVATAADGGNTYAVPAIYELASKVEPSDETPTPHPRWETPATENWPDSVQLLPELVNRYVSLVPGELFATGALTTAVSPSPLSATVLPNQSLVLVAPAGSVSVADGVSVSAQPP